MEIVRMASKSIQDRSHWTFVTAQGGQFQVPIEIFREHLLSKAQYEKTREPRGGDARL